MRAADQGAPTGRSVSNTVCTSPVGPLPFRLRPRGDGDRKAVERGIRPLASNRDNASLSGFNEGDDNWALITTLIDMKVVLVFVWLPQLVMT
jgi:hypothetical protein